jgi:hypothetical protein
MCIWYARKNGFIETLTTINIVKPPVFAYVCPKAIIFGHCVTQKSCTRSTGYTEPTHRPSLK